MVFGVKNEKWMDRLKEKIDSRDHSDKEEKKYFKSVSKLYRELKAKYTEKELKELFDITISGGNWNWYNPPDFYKGDKVYSIAMQYAGSGSPLWVSYEDLPLQITGDDINNKIVYWRLRIGK